MNAIVSLIVAEHQLKLQREAEIERLAKEALEIGGGSRRSPVQRLAGRSARGLSRGLAALAARVDPIEAGRQSTSSDRQGRPSLSEDPRTTGTRGGTGSSCCSRQWRGP